MEAILDKYGLTAGSDDITIPFHTELYVCEKIENKWWKILPMFIVVVNLVNNFI
jgi:hypothetical protein